jgi:predicted ribosomally synthesized peptide with nif11-like leader
MSLEKAKAFLDHVSLDAKLRTQVQAPGHKALMEVLAVAKKHGFECTGAELHNALRDRFGATNIPAANNDDEANCIALAAR